MRWPVGKGSKMVSVIVEEVTCARQIDSIKFAGKLISIFPFPESKFPLRSGLHCLMIRNLAKFSAIYDQDTIGGLRILIT